MTTTSTPKKSKYNFGLSLKFETLNFEAVKDLERWMLEGGANDLKSKNLHISTGVYALKFWSGTDFRADLYF